MIRMAISVIAHYLVRRMKAALPFLLYFYLHALKVPEKKVLKLYPDVLLLRRKPCVASPLKHKIGPI